jgi:hypothetical protein
MLAKGGETYFVLAMERQLWLALQSFPRRLAAARFPPNCDVRDRDLLCPLHVETGQADWIFTLEGPARLPPVRAP